jgi:hypothetical protein
MHNRSRLLTTCLLFLLASWCTVPASGQQFQGSMTGVVKDQTGAVIPGAQVTVVEQGTGFTRSGQTLQDGSYNIPLLPPGEYRVKASRRGFRTSVQGPFTLLVNAHLKINFQLKVGAQTTTMVVSAPTPVLQTQTSSVGTTVGDAEVQQIPLNGRQFLELTYLTAGVAPANGGSELSTRGGGINVNGLRESMNEFLLDGMNNTSIGVGTFAVTPPLGSIQEFRMETGTYDARFGDQGGAQVNMILKSGTNQWHGNLFDFLRNQALNTRNLFDPTTPPFVRNDFGVTLGGPLRIPGVYNGHNHTFFFGAYEGLRSRETSYTNFYVPTVSERQGDFSDLLSPSCSAPTVLINPVALLQGQVETFTNITQVLPHSDPVGQKMVNLYPEPNIAGAACGASNYEAPGNEMINDDSYSARVDHIWGSKDIAFFQIAETLERDFLPFGEDGGELPGYGEEFRNGFLIAGVDWTHTLTPSLVNEAKFDYNRWQLRYLNQDMGIYEAQALGIQDAHTGLQASGVPDISISPYEGIGAATNAPQAGAVNTWELGDTLTQMHGDHSLAYGVDFTSVKRGNFFEADDIRSDWSFTGDITAGLGEVTPAELGLPANTILGNGLADALLGLPTDWINGLSAYISGAETSQAYFVQDNWRVRPNFTLNLGLRYEYNDLLTDQGNHFDNFDFSNGDLMVAGNSAATLMTFNSSTGLYQTVGSLNLGTEGENRSLQYPSHGDVGPRFGLAWQISKNTVVRGGWGAYYDKTFGDVDFQKVGPPYTVVNLGEITSALPSVESGALKLDTGEIIDDALEPDLVSPYYPEFNAYDLHYRDGFIQDWSLDVQRALPGSFLLDVGYVGTRGLYLPFDIDANQPVPNPQTLTAVSPYPEYGEIDYVDSSGSSIYNSLQVKVDKHFSRGMSILGSYTWAQSIDTNSDFFGSNNSSNFPQNSDDLAAEKALSSFNIPQRFTLGYLYDLPFGTSMATLKSLGLRGLGFAIRNWELSGFVQVESGPPFTVGESDNISGTDVGDDRPNAIGNPYPAKQTVNQWVLASAFRAQAPYTFGDAGRDSLEAPGLSDWDFSLIRRFHLTESKVLEFRTEIFNLFNQPNFSVPNGNLDSPGFGTITNTLPLVAGFASGGPGDPREIQFALKLVF